MKPIITATELSLLLKKQDIVLIEAGSGKEAKLRYKEGRLASALYVDLNEHLAKVPENAVIGGRHPLPDIEKFSDLLGNLGIDKNSHVVVYDDKQGSNAAARFWWMLRAAGHTAVQVLSGGLQAAVSSGFSIKTDTLIVNPKKPYPFSAWQLPLKNIDEVKEASENETAVIVDVRDSERFLGVTEPLDPIAGHIKNAINIPFRSNLNAVGEFLPESDLYEKYAPLFEQYSKDNIIVHCGSGVTACHTLLAMAQAGLGIPSLYEGSWSEWCRNYPDKP